MGNIGTTLKRFFSNKNTVTLIAIVLCTIVLWLFYNNRVNRAVRKVTACYAQETIPARAKITQSMVTSKDVLLSSVSGNMVTDCNSVIGMYASYATEIPQNAFFFEEMLMTEDEMPDSAFDDIPDGYTLYRLAVTFESTYGNSIFPGNYIDLYLVGEDEVSGNIMYGKFIQSIQVLGVKDEEGQNVFETTVETRKPSQLLFSVPDDLYLLLYKAQLLGLEIVIVPRNNNYTAVKGQTLVSSEYLKQYVLDQTAGIPDECVTDTTGTAECQVNAVQENTNTAETTTETTEQTQTTEETQTQE